MRLQASAGSGLHRARFEINLTEQMVLSIGDVKRVAVERHSLRTGKAGRFERTADHAMHASADYVDQRPIKFGDHNAIMIRVGDEEAIRFLISQDFARKSER